MCINPGVLANGQMIACRKCYQCKEGRINNWVGRCIGESKTAKASHFVTLTYGHDKRYGAPTSDHERAAMLTYSDIQRMIRALRDAGYPLRYLAVGEYGNLKGRAHWHLLIFWKDKVPPGIKLSRNLDWEFWPHGFSQFGTVEPASARYCCKYIQKDEDTEKQMFIMMSKKPPLGSEWFRQLARRYVVQYLAPQDLSYQFPGEAMDTKGQPITYWMHDKTALHFIRAYLEIWQEVHPKIHAPWSELVDTYADKLLAAERVDDDAFMEALAIELRYRRNASKESKPFLPVPGGESCFWDERLNTWAAPDAHGMLYWSFDERGNRSWSTILRSESDVEKRRPKETPELGPNLWPKRAYGFVQSR